MKSKSKELDIDFIGVQGTSLTKEEEIAISNYIRANKTKLSGNKSVVIRQTVRKHKTGSRKTVA